MIRVLSFLKIVDAHDGLVSLTNVALIIALVKFALLRNVGLPDLSAFFLALLAYSVKRHSRAQTSTAIDTVNTAVDKLSAKVTALDNRTKR